jgi:hypothetical protein
LRSRLSIASSRSKRVVLGADWSVGVGRAWSELLSRRRISKHRRSTRGMALEVKRICREMCLESEVRNHHHFRGH